MDMTQLRDPACAGLYACDHDIDAWTSAAAAAGLMVLRVDLEHCGTRGAILDAFADACNDWRLFHV